MEMDHWSQRVLAMLLCLALLVPFALYSAPAAAAQTVSVTAEESAPATVTVVAGSDFQYSNADHSIAGGQVESILTAMKADGYTDIDGFLFAGDYSQAFTEDATKAGLSYLQGVVSSAYPDLSDENKLWVQGNHDPDALVENGTLSYSGANDSEDYGVFLINEKDYMWYNDDETTVKATAANLRAYLNAKSKIGYTKPIFVVSHLPLNYNMRTNGYGDAMYANYLFDVLNEAGANGLNIIFLFGHDHSNGWDDYLGGSAIYLAKGDKILIAQASTTEFKEETLNFTYMNAGYVGYYSNVNTGAETDLTMTVFQITEDDVTIGRYTSSGIHDLKSAGVTNAYKSETAYSPDTRVYASTQTVVLNKEINTTAVTGVKITGDGISDTFVSKAASQVPAGYNAYDVYDISATGYTDGEEVTITLPVEENFSADRPALVIDHKTGKVTPVLIDGGSVTFTADHLGGFTLAQADVDSVSGSGTVGKYLRLVGVSGSLKENVPYVITDAEISGSSHWMLTTTSGYYTSSSGAQYQGFVLEETASAETEYVWYYDGGNLRSQSTSGDNFLLISFNGDYNGTSTDCVISVGAYDAASAAVVKKYSSTAAYYQIKRDDDTNVMFLQRRGGGTNNIATSYTSGSSSNSLWYFYEVVSDAALTVTPSQTTMEENGSILMMPVVQAGSEIVSDHAISWSSEDESIATVSADGVVTPKKAGQVYITATLNAVEGNTLSSPATVRIMITVVSVDRTDSSVTVSTHFGNKITSRKTLTAGTASGPYVLIEYRGGWMLTGNTLLSTDEGYNGKGIEGLELIPSLGLYDEVPMWYYDGTNIRYGSATATDQYLVYDGAMVTLGADNGTNVLMTLENSSYSGYYYVVGEGLSGKLNHYGGRPYNVVGLYDSNSYYWIFRAFSQARQVSMTVTPMKTQLLPGQTVALDRVVKVDGTAVSDYHISWSSSDLSVATVDNSGNITAVSSGSITVTATLTSADGTTLDGVMAVDIPVQVVGVEQNAGATTMTLELDMMLEPVSQLESGQAYVITSRLNPNWVMTNNFKVADRDTSYFGPWLEHLQTAADNHVWYYVEETVDGVTGQYLRYGSLEDSENYLSYTSRIGRLGALATSNIYNTVTKVSDSVDAFYIRSTVDGSVVRGLNQHGGAGYDAAVPTSLYLNDGGSSWVFNRIIPSRALSWTVATDPMSIHTGKADPINYAITLDEVEQSEYEIVWTSSDEAVASVSGGQVTAVGTGDATITATLKSVDGQALNTPLTVDIPVSVSDHSWTDASCTAPKTCEICGVTEGESIGHQYQAVTTLPNCTESGYTTYTCSVCGDSYTSDIVSANGHSYSAEKVDATCTEEGYTVYTCNDCGDSYTADIVSATGHSYQGVVTDATCTEDGFTTYTCAVCGDSYTADTVSATGHSWVDATCTDAKYCSVCGTTEGSALGHSYTSKVTAPTCTEGGFTTYTCSTCGDSYVADNTAASGHSYVGKTTAPTCTADGYTVYTCSACGDSYTGDTVAATGHSYENGACTLCGAADPDYVAAPTLTLSYPTLSFEDEILYNAYFTVSDAANIVEMGMITFDSRLSDGTIADAVEIIPGYTVSGSNYIVSSNGIPAKNMSDALYFKVYAKLSDGSYVYTDVAGYNAVAYANTILNNASTSAEAKALVVAMLNYGAAAQVQFDYKTDSLMNASLTAEQLALVDAYDESMVDAVVKADSSKVGLFVHNGGYTQLFPTVSFEGAFSINYYFTTAYTPDSAPTFYYWDAATYNSAAELTAENATGVLAMEQEDGMWLGTVSGIAAKEIDQTYYTAGIYTVGDTTYYSPVVSYSLGSYCETLAAQDNAFGAATAVYGYYAKAYFAS